MYRIVGRSPGLGVERGEDPRECVTAACRVLYLRFNSNTKIGSAPSKICPVLVEALSRNRGSDRTLHEVIYMLPQANCAEQ